MTDQSYLLDDQKQRSKKSIWIGRLFKLSFFLIAMFLILITILANMGGSSEGLRKQVEGFASEVFYGRPAKLETLKRLSFFPTSGIDIEGLEVYTTETSLVPFVSVGKFRVYMSFWAIAARTPYIKDLYVENARAVKGVFGPNEIFVEKLYIDNDLLQNTAKIKGNGKLGVHKWSFSMDILPKPSGNGFKYRLKEEFPFTLSLSDVSIRGHFMNQRGGAYLLKDLVIESEKSAMTGEIALSAPSENLMAVRGKLLLDTKNEAEASQPVTLNVDTLINFASSPTKFTGSIETADTKMNKIFGDEGALSIIKRVRDILGYNAFEQDGLQFGSFLGPYDMDLAVKLGNIDWFENNADAELSFPVVQESGKVRIGPTSKNGEKVTPALMIVRSEDNKKRIALLSPGALGLKALKEYLPKYDQVINQDALDVECGLGHITYQGRKVMIKNMQIKAEDANVLELNDVLLETVDGLSAAAFSDRNAISFENVDLKAETYDFIKPHFDSLPNNANCMSYFTRIDPPAPEPEPTQDEAAVEATQKEIQQ